MRSQEELRAAMSSLAKLSNARRVIQLPPPMVTQGSSCSDHRASTKAITLRVLGACSE